MKFSFQLSAVSSQLNNSSRHWWWETILLEEHKKARLGAPQQEIPDSLLRPYHEQVLAVLDRLSIDRQFLDDLPGNV